MLPAYATSVADEFVDDNDDVGSAPTAAESVVQFCPTIQVPALVARGFRPLATALAAQRSGGRSAPLVAAPLDGSPLDGSPLDSSPLDGSLLNSSLGSASSEGGELQWECFLSLLGARGHLELSGIRRIPESRGLFERVAG